MKSNTPPTVPGSRYGRLLVLAEAEPHLSRSGRPVRRWLCRCICGAETMVLSPDLRSGHTLSCGCLQRDATAESARTRATTHGMSKSREFRIWGGMLSRCQNRNDPYFHRYGGRGITVCDRWRTSFVNFYADMGPRPTPEHTIDRIDNDGPYSPENCRWITRKEQCRNKSNNVWITFEGETLSVAEWAKRKGLRGATLWNRLHLGWSVEAALTRPVGRPRGKQVR